MRIDAHRHYWTTARSDYGWLSTEAGRARFEDRLPKQLEPELARNGVDGTIVVQAARALEPRLRISFSRSENAITMPGIGKH